MSEAHTEKFYIERENDEKYTGVLFSGRCSGNDLHH